MIKTLSEILDDSVEAMGFPVEDNPFSIRLNPEKLEGTADDLEGFVLQTKRCGNIKVTIDSSVELLAIDFDNE